MSCSSFLFSFFFFFNGKFGSPLEYHRATCGTTRSYPSPLGIMSIHQFRSKPNKYGKKLPCGNRTQDLLVPKPYPTHKMPQGYKAMGCSGYQYFCIGDKTLSNRADYLSFSIKPAYFLVPNNLPPQLMREKSNVSNSIDIQRWELRV
ncbi:hypothetical protein Hanom_Chr00s002522g01701121 [Helianthus anomalus]